MTPGDGVVFDDSWLIDWLVMLAWVAIGAAIGVPLFLGGNGIALVAGDDRQALPPAARRG